MKTFSQLCRVQSRKCIVLLPAVNCALLPRVAAKRQKHRIACCLHCFLLFCAAR
jgi:hypothetical protein